MASDPTRTSRMRSRHQSAVVPTDLVDCAGKPSADAPMCIGVAASRLPVAEAHARSWCSLRGLPPRAVMHLPKRASGVG